MYQKRGYGIFQTVDKYYSSGLRGTSKKEDAYDMRLKLSHAKTDQFTAPTGKTIKPSNLKYH